MEFCRMCQAMFIHYMVRDAVWKKAMDLLDRSASVCFHCLQNRLSRQLTRDDFDFSLVINHNIALGFQMGAIYIKKLVEKEK